MTKNANNVEELYKKILIMWLHAEKVNYKKLESLVDKLINKAPYFRDPDIYFCKFKCLIKNNTGEAKDKMQFKIQIKKCLDNFIFSYFANRDSIDMDKLCATGIMAEGIDLYIGDGDKWRYIGFIKDMLAYSIEKKLYRTTGDVTGFWFRRLSDAYSHHESENSASFKNLLLLTNIYTALEHLESENYDDALECFEEVLNTDVNNPTANYGMGRIYFESDEYKDTYKALDFLEKADTFGIREWKNYYLLAKLYIQKNNYTKAKKNYLKALNFFNEKGLFDLFIEAKNDLGSHADDLLLKDILLKKENIAEDSIYRKSDYITKTNFDSLDKETLKNAKERADENIHIALDVYSNELEEESMGALKLAENAYAIICESPKELGPTLCSNYRYYIAVLENEILLKIFKNFKLSLYQRSDYFPKLEQLIRIARKTYFCKFLTNTSKCYIEPNLTLGETLGILNRQNKKNLALKDNEIYDNFFKYIAYCCPILLESDFKNKLSELNEAQNNIKHTGNLRALTVHDDFMFFRNPIMGNTRKHGLLLDFLKSYTHNKKQ